MSLNFELHNCSCFRCLKAASIIVFLFKSFQRICQSILHLYHFNILILSWYDKLCRFISSLKKQELYGVFACDVGVKVIRFLSIIASSLTFFLSLHAMNQNCTELHWWTLLFYPLRQVPLFFSRREPHSKELLSLLNVTTLFKHIISHTQDGDLNFSFVLIK